MLKNDKANASGTRLPNENYAREIMQLFSIGLYNLNLDGSLTLSSAGLPIADLQPGCDPGNGGGLYRLDLRADDKSSNFQSAGRLARSHGQRRQPSFSRCQDDLERRSDPSGTNSSAGFAARPSTQFSIIRMSDRFSADN